MICLMTKRPTDTPAPRKAKSVADEPRRGGGARAIADLMPRIGDQAFRRFGFVQASIVTRWAEIAGPRHAGMSEPESIRFPAGRKEGGTLVLLVESGFAPILQHGVPDIIERVNRFFGYGAVAKVAIKTGTVAVREPERRPPPANLRPVPADLGDSLRDIGDAELRAVLEAMARGLAKDAPLGKIS